MKYQSRSTSILIVFILLRSHVCFSQVKIHTEDLKNFYTAYDSVLKINDSTKQKIIIENLYYEPGSLGLKEFIKIDNHLTSSELLKYINENKQHLDKIRPWVLSANQQQKVIEEKLKIYQSLYSDFKSGDIYFLMGKGYIGGKPFGRSLLIGAELMATENPEWSLPIVLHEYTHTQQYILNNIQELKWTQILSNCLFEGMCDFISELIYEVPLPKFYPNHYIEFGLKHETEVWEKFKDEMFLSMYDFPDKKNWLYGMEGKEFSGQKVKDLGYFMGYQICKSYYYTAKDKKKAITNMLNYKLSTDEDALNFLLESNYVKETEKNEIIDKFKASKKK